MRKLREWEVYHALREGRADELEGVVRIEAPADYDHVITYVTQSWLPRQARPIIVPPDQRPGFDQELSSAPRAADKASAAGR
jgi:hypothetical protein